MVNQLTIPASNVSQLLTLGYTHIEIWESTDYGNSYHETTASAVAAAQLVSSPAATQFDIGGCTLKFSLNNGPEIAVTFSNTVRYWTATQVVNQINIISPNAAALSSDSLSVILKSPTTGRGSTVAITYNDCAQLGWVTGNSANGFDARIPLVGGTLVYTYSDLGGQDQSKYKWRYSVNGLAPISNYSAAVLPTPTSVVGSANLAIATAFFADASGNALQRSVIVVTVDPPQSLNGFTVGNQLPLVFTADETGFLQIPLVRGATVRVAIDGTSLVREFVVPSSTTFDLLTVLGTATDPMTVQTTPPLLTRRSV